jgi:putative membrane protein
MQNNMELFPGAEGKPSANSQTLMAQDWLKVILLIGLGTYFIYNIITGNLNNYINIRFAWLSYVAAALFVLLGGVGAYRLLSEGPQHPALRMYKLSWGTLLILAIPLFLGVFIPSQPLGAAAIGSSGINNNTIATDNVTTFTTNPLDRNVLDWVRVFNGSDDLASFNGQEADIVGFVYRDEEMPENQFLLARFTISCCVADSMAIGLPVVWDEALEMDTWLQVKGQFQLGDFRGEQTPILQPTSLERIDQPEHPYLYP